MADVTETNTNTNTNTNTENTPETPTEQPTEQPTEPTTAQRTYSYDPSKICDGGVDQMRFELGDTIVDMGDIQRPLCDEEYAAMIGSTSSWKRAKLKCLKAILMKFAYEVNTSTDGLSYSLSDRFDRWKAMYDDLKKKAEAAVPVCNPNALGGKDGEDMYFHYDMLSNPNKYR